MKTVILNEIPIMPGETGQMFTRLAGNNQLMDLSLDEHVKVLKVIAGSHRFEPPAEGEKWADVLKGTALGPNTYVTIVVENPTKETRGFKVGLVLDGGEEEVSAPRAAAGAARAATVLTRKRAQSATVTPGSNEVAVLLKRGEAMRLIESIKGGMPIRADEQPAMLRAFDDAMSRTA